MIFVYSACVYAAVPIFLHISDPNEPTYDPNEPLCDYHNAQNEMIIKWIDLLNLVLVSFPIANLFTLLTCAYIYRSRRRAFLASTTRSRSSMLKDRKYAINSIVIDFLNFVCVTPIVVILVLSLYIEISDNENDLLFVIGDLFYTFNSSSAFIINITVNSIFYTQFSRMIRLTKRQTNNNNNNTNNFNIAS